MSNLTPFIIAEAGVNHNGKLSMAMELAERAMSCGASAVKFQTFKVEHLVKRGARKAVYQEVTTGAYESQYDMLESLQLSEESFLKLAAHCGQLGIQFMSSPFDCASLRFLVEELGLSRVKLGSGEITNAPILVAAGATNLPVILSTGMSSLGEIETAIGALAWGAINRHSRLPRGKQEFLEVLLEDEGQSYISRNVTLLHCTTDYPSKAREINLRAVDTLRSSFGTKVGLSDHSEGIHIPIAAAALGIEVLEKHFTLDRKLPGPDHRASLDPQQFAQMVNDMNEVVVALGDGIKRPKPSEISNRLHVRKSIVVSGSVERGARLSERNLTTKRPGSGVSAIEYFDYLGRECLSGLCDEDEVNPSNVRECEAE